MLISSLLQPLADRVDAGDIRLLLSELGLSFPSSLETDGGLVASTQSAVSQLEQLSVDAEALVTAVRNEDIGAIGIAGVALAQAIAGTITSLEGVAGAIRSAGGGAGIPAAELNQFCDRLPARLVDYLAVRRLESLPGVADALEFAGAVNRTIVPAVDASHPAYELRELHLTQLLGFLKDPAGTLLAAYGWGSPGFDGVALLTTLHRLLTLSGVPAVLDTSGPHPVLDVVFLEITPALDVNPPGLKLTIVQPFEVDTGRPFVQDDWQLQLDLGIAVGVGDSVIVQPNDRMTIRPAAGQVSGDVTLKWVGSRADGTPYTIIGVAGATRLDVRKVLARLQAGFTWNPAAGQAEADFTMSGSIVGGRVIIDLSSADHFISTLLNGAHVDSDFAVDFGYSSAHGLFFQGGAGLDIQIPVHASAGPVDVTAVTLSAGIQTDGISAGAAADVQGSLGPVQAVLQQIGFTALFRMPSDQHGNLGPLDVGFRFRPPTGAGLEVDVGVVTGGGFLHFDPAAAEYSGALELEFLDFLALKAIGLITTRMPDGSPGFSLLLVLSAEFPGGLQLGYGFTLLAVGGLIGLNRSMRLDAIIEGVRTGAIESVMFPRDVVANAPRILSDLRAFFPPHNGIFLIGPMAKLGWGTPTLVSASLAVIIEIPGDVAIIGVLKVALPTEAEAILLLQVNFAGVIEFDKKRLYFFASLYQSRILTITIEGELGLLVAYGDRPDFVLSVGGFHPSFKPPPLPFPAPRRISINILNNGVERISVDGYFAVTSNTAQFGAHAELFFGFSALSISGHVGFDALFQFSPFRFVIDITAGVSVKAFGVGVFSVSLALTLSGPAPWEARGTASISLLFFSIPVDFDVTWGERRDTTLPPVSVLPLLAAELRKPESWRTRLPAGGTPMVTVRGLAEAEADVVLHPQGTLLVRQRAVPLDIRVDKVGSERAADVSQCQVAVDGDGLVKVSDAADMFALAQFQNLSDAQKLSLPSFEPEHAGLELAPDGAALASHRAVRRSARYEQIIISPAVPVPSVRHFVPYNSTLFKHFLGGASVTRSPLAQAQRTLRQPFTDLITVPGESYVVASSLDNTAAGPVFSSHAQARVHLESLLAADPARVGQLHVIPAVEVAT